MAERVNVQYKDRFFRLLFGSKALKDNILSLYNALNCTDYNNPSELKLSDAFINPDKTNKFEWTAIMYNLNKGKNDDLLRRCKPLADYMTLIINYIREFQIDYELSVVVDKAIDCCIEENEEYADITEEEVKKYY